MYIGCILLRNFDDILSFSTTISFLNKSRSDDHHGNLQVTNLLDTIHNLVLPISVSQEKPKISWEETTTYEIHHPPPDSFSKENFVINHLGDEEC